MWKLAGKTFNSHFLLGTANYPSLDVLKGAIKTAQSEIITVSLTRIKFNDNSGNPFIKFLTDLNCDLLPNTAGCYSALDAIRTAHLASEVFNTKWVKLEVIGDDYTLHPNVMELLKATESLLRDGFTIFPYCSDDVIICQELINLGCEVLMPMASPIGSGQGILNEYNLKLLRDKFPSIKLIVDAGIGRPSDALKVMELGFDGVLLNTAVSNSINPENMAYAFNLAINAGQIAYNSGIMPKRDFAVASTQYNNKPFAKEIGL